jgi:hypothetical protein
VEIAPSWQDSKVDQEKSRQKHKCIYGQERSSLPSSSKLPFSSTRPNADIFSAEPPFDRHDWIVTRPVPDAPKDSPAPTTTTRYVIDYYSAPEDEEGNPVFILDVRPALDDFASLAQRVKMGWEDWKTGEHENQ